VLVKRTFLYDPCSSALLTSPIMFMGWGVVGWSGLLTFCPRRTSKYFTNFSSLTTFIWWGVVLTFCPQSTSKYVTNFSNHVDGVGWGGVGWGGVWWAINVLSTKNFQVGY